MINISEEYTSWNNRLKVEMRKKTENQSEWVCFREKERESKVKCHSSVPVESRVVREQAGAGNPGRLSSEWKMSNIHSNSSTRPKTIKSPIWLHLNKNQNACHNTASASPCTIFGMLNTLEAACEELPREDRWPALTQVESVSWQISNRPNFPKAGNKSKLLNWTIWGLNVRETLANVSHGKGL